MAPAKLELGVRLGEKRNWKLLKQREIPAGDPGKIRRGDNKACLSKIVALRDAHPLALPIMLPLSPSLSIMGTDVTIGLFDQVMMEGGYTFQDCKPGFLASNIKHLLATNPEAAGMILKGVCLNDAIAFAERLGNLTNRNFRVPTDVELLQADKQLTSAGNVTWARLLPMSIRYVLCKQTGSHGISPSYPGNTFSIRLFEDIPEDI